MIASQDTQISSLTTTFENYNDVSNFYDNARVPAGIETIIKQLEDPSTATVLDAGAGTGNFMCPMAGRVAKVVAYEINEGMISQLRNKVEKQSLRNVTVVQGSITESADVANLGNEFDLVMVNHVVHHLDQPEDNFMNFKKAVKNLYPVLKKGGKLCINTSFVENIEGNWMYNHEESNKQHMSRFAGHDIFQQAFEEAGFANYTEVIGVEPFLGQNYFNHQFPFSEDNRKTESYFTDVEDLKATDELCDQFKKMQEDGTFQAYFDKQEEIRMVKGLFTTAIGTKE